MKGWKDTLINYESNAILYLDINQFYYLLTWEIQITVKSSLNELLKFTYTISQLSVEWKPILKFIFLYSESFWCYWLTSLQADRVSRNFPWLLLLRWELLRENIGLRESTRICRLLETPCDPRELRSPRLVSPDR